MKQMDICERCKKRDNCEGFVERTSDSFRYVYFCPKFVHDNGKPFSQADRIRSMSDEELALFLCNIHEPDEDTIVIDDKEFFAETEILEWLQSEVEEIK